MNQEQIINKALHLYKSGQNVFSSEICESIDKLHHHDRIHTIIQVIKKINEPAETLILYGKLTESFNWLTEDDIKEIKKRV